MRIFLIIIALLGSLGVQANQANSANEVVDLSKYKGKVVYLDFWASWCVPCRKSFPWMNKMRDRYSAENLAIVAVNLDKEAHLAQAFLKQHPANFDVLFDAEGRSAKKYQIPGMPTSILFDPSGKVISAHSGFFKKKISEYEQQLEAAVSALKNSPSKE